MQPSLKGSSFVPFSVDKVPLDVVSCYSLVQMMYSLASDI